MRRRLPVLLSAIALLSLLGTTPLVAQDGSSAPRTPWGDPALQGAWTNATMTPLQRPTDLADREFLTEEEVAARQGEVAERSSLDNRPRTETGAYNEFWMERGNLNRRTSLVIDPPNGRLPALTGPEQNRQSRRTDSYIAAKFDSWLDFNKLDRCITRGLPGAMMPGFYNHNYQIVQTQDHIVILVEMIHDARIIPLDGRGQLDSNLRQWLGASRGHWEGDTLVIETTNFNDKITGRGGTVFGGSEHLKVVERLTRLSADTIDYEITVSDPTVWAEPWTVAVPMTAMDQTVFEYACHEGNYALPNILSGARAEEREAAGQQQ